MFIPGLLGKSSAPAILAQPKLAATYGANLRSKNCGGRFSFIHPWFSITRQRSRLVFNPRHPMTKISSLASATAVVSILLMGAASAQTAAPAKTDATKTEAKAPAEKKAEKPRTAASLECSKEADAKGLHGKE